MYILTVNYSFDSSVEAWLFATYEAACAELKKQFEEELRIQIKENGHVEMKDLEASHEDDWNSASISIDSKDLNYESSKDVMYWTVSDLKNTAGLGNNHNDFRSEAEAIIEDHPKLSDAIYRASWKEHVKNDVLDRIEENYADVIPKNRRNEVADNVAEMYVYEGDYDCNLDYWSQLDSLIDDLKYVLG